MKWVRKKMTLVAVGGMLFGGGCLQAGAADAAGKKKNGPVRVVVWDERQPRQKQAYPDFLGNQIAKALSVRPGLSVKSVSLDDPGQGISDKVLDQCDVLIWWGHVRQGLIKPDQGKRIVKRIRAGKLSLVALHSAHWSTPFIEAMNSRAKEEALGQVPAAARGKALLKLLPPDPPLYRAPKRSAALTPAASFFRNKDGRYEVNLRLPNCCFPAYRPDGKPSTIITKVPEHPIARGLPKSWGVAHTEMYDCLLYTSPSPRDLSTSRMPSSA